MSTFIFWTNDGNCLVDFEAIRQCIRLLYFRLQREIRQLLKSHARCLQNVVVQYDHRANFLGSAEVCHLLGIAPQLIDRVNHHWNIGFPQFADATLVPKTITVETNSNKKGDEIGGFNQFGGDLKLAKKYKWPFDGDFPKAFQSA